MVKLQQPSTWIIIAIIAGGILIFYVTHLDEVPISGNNPSYSKFTLFKGRKRMIAVSPETELQMGMQAYKEVLAQNAHKLLPPSNPVLFICLPSPSHSFIQHVKAVKKLGMRIVDASGMANLKKFHW